VTARTFKQSRVAELQKQKTALERKIEELEDAEVEQDDLRTDAADHFQILVAELDRFVSIRSFPVRLQLQLEEVCRLLGVPRVW
jgi:plasmid maintenance system killer protein